MVNQIGNLCIDTCMAVTETSCPNSFSEADNPLIVELVSAVLTKIIEGNRSIVNPNVSSCFLSNYSNDFDALF
jgi:hypothetical protein